MAFALANRFRETPAPGRAMPFGEPAVGRRRPVRTTFLDDRRSGGPKRYSQVNAFVRVNAPGGVYSDKAAFTLASHPSEKKLDFALLIL